MAQKSGLVISMSDDIPQLTVPQLAVKNSTNFNHLVLERAEFLE